MAAPRPTLGHYQGGSLIHPMLITCILHIRPEGHQEPHNEVGSLSPAEHLVGFELAPKTFSFNPFATFALNFKAIPSASPKLLNLNQWHPLTDIMKTATKFIKTNFKGKSETAIVDKNKM